MSEPKLISVIITTYNHAQYLTQSIGSVLSQSYNNLELIVVDDGSTDNTKEVVGRYMGTQYVYQSNQGLSAARNTGIDKSKGDYLIFLDADDWFFEGALEESARSLEAHPQAAFVYGTYKTVNNSNEIISGAYDKQDFINDHYLHLLHHNFIAMHATVLYRRWAVECFRFDTVLKACEDYDLYLKITRDYTVAYHPYTVAAYRRHSQNMSDNVRLMIKYALKVLERQAPLLRTKAEKEMLHNGRMYWKNFYGKILYWQLEQTAFLSFHKKKLEILGTLFKYNRKLFLQYLKAKTSMGIKTILKQKSPAFILSLLHSTGFYKSYRPAVGKIIRGDFGSKPFSINFGYDRGGPVDRYYIENFLEQNAGAIKGRVLEIGDNEYTLRYGSYKVKQSDVLHVDENNAKATFVGDLSNAPHLPDNSFDCIVLTQTLHLIYAHADALRTCYRILKPGGVLLLTVPGISQVDMGEWQDYWLWSYTQASIKKLLSEAFSPGRFEIETFGNVLVATAFLYGIGLPEMKKEELDAHDSHYQVIITAKATKPNVI